MSILSGRRIRSMWKNFSGNELRCRGKCAACEGTENNMSPDLMNRLQRIRDKMGVPLPVSSAYRCPEYNDKVSSTGKNGPHTTGRAVDIAVSGRTALVLVGMALEEGITGIGINQKGPVEKRFIHLDMCYDLPRRPRPWIWSY